MYGTNTFGLDTSMNNVDHLPSSIATAIHNHQTCEGNSPRRIPKVFTNKIVPFLPLFFASILFQWYGLLETIFFILTASKYA